VPIAIVLLICCDVGEYRASCRNTVAILPFPLRRSAMDGVSRSQGKGRRGMARTETRSPPISRKSAGASTSVLTPDQKVDEASIESMDGSDPPGYLPMRVGAPRDHKAPTHPSEAIGPLARDIWKEARRPSRRPARRLRG
jgi:hypothetical protein